MYCTQCIILMALFDSESAIRFETFSPGVVFLIHFLLCFCSAFGLHQLLREHPSPLLLNASLHSPAICSLSTFVCDVKSCVLVQKSQPTKLVRGCVGSEL